jgi:hypothetical protein
MLGICRGGMVILISLASVRERSMGSTVMSSGELRLMLDNSWSFDATLR